MIRVSQLIQGFVILFLFSAVQAQTPAHDAAKRGDLEALRKMRFEGKNLYEPDAGGFTPYEMAALWANPRNQEAFQKQVGIMLWLKEYKPEKHKFGKASTKLVQAGLRMLGFDGGTVDGVIGERTRKAIIDFQRELEVAETGTLGPHWLGAMYREVLKELQTRLTALGYNTYGKDGLMGPRTQKAIMKFRQEHVTANPDYKGIDAELISAINRVTEDKEKAEQEAQALKAKEKAERDTQYLQAGLTTLGYKVGKVDGLMGGRTKRALEKWQKKQGLPVQSELDEKSKKAFKKSVVKITQQKLNALGYKTGKPDGLPGKATFNAVKQFGKRYGSSQALNSESIVAIDVAFDTMKEANAEAERKAAAVEAKKKAARIARQKEEKQKAKALAAKKAAEKKAAEAKAARKLAEKRKAQAKAAKKKAEQKAAQKAAELAVKKAAEKEAAAAKAQADLSNIPLAKTLPIDAPTTVEPVNKAKLDVKIRNNIASQKPELAKPATSESDVIKPQRKNKIVPIKTSSSSTGARNATGKMTFRRSNGRVVGCAIAGRNLPIEWCEPFYPLPKNNRCSATFKSNGSVIGVKCN